MPQRGRASRRRAGEGGEPATTGAELKNVGGYLTATTAGDPYYVLTHLVQALGTYTDTIDGLLAAVVRLQDDVGHGVL